ncbi:MAG TPA: methyltransferase domain-containing protein, partial [Promineifilum sp.]|nr:methyltransferase domain-containing protein [Promineifilum sp.]
MRLGREGQLALLPRWVSEKLDVHLWETNRLLAQAQAELPPGARLLDAGSGEGQYRDTFKHLRYVGVDLAVGDQTWDYTGLDAQGDLSHLPFADDSFDAAVCFQVLEH